MNKGQPPPEAWEYAANEQAKSSQQVTGAQTLANRPNISTPFGKQQWTQGPDGTWNMSTGFSGGLGDAAAGLTEQAGNALSTPFSLGGLGDVGTGDAARDQAINAAYGQATSRLDPMWNKREEATRTRLLNQGLDPTSEAFKSEMGDLGLERNDAYTSAMNSAVGAGTAAGDSAFRNNMMSRQQRIAEMLRERNQPLENLQGLQGLLAMPGFQGAGRAEVLQFLNALSGISGQAQAANAAGADMAGGLFGLGAAALSDERAKTNIVRHEFEVIPGVQVATWEYIGLPGQRFIGVIAQDLEKVAPQYVFRRWDGMRVVDYSFLDGGVFHG